LLPLGIESVYTTSNSGLPKKNILSIIVVADGNKWIGTSSGLYFLDESKIILDVKENNKTNIIKEFSLMQNYPNPFNLTTNIGFRISDFGFVTLRVYDILGKEIAVLVNEEKSAGSYTVNFSATGGGRNLTSGVYV
jgi:hypothetical protein